MDVFTMYLATDRVDDGYLKVLVIEQAALAETLCKLFAVIDGCVVGFEIDSDSVAERNAIFHIEKEFLHWHLHVRCLVRHHFRLPIRTT
jgi:hypothetical protein